MGSEFAKKDARVKRIMPKNSNKQKRSCSVPGGRIFEQLPEGKAAGKHRECAADLFTLHLSHSIEEAHVSGPRISPANTSVVQCKGGGFSELNPEIKQWLSQHPILDDIIKQYDAIPLTDDHYTFQEGMLKKIRKIFYKCVGSKRPLGVIESGFRDALCNEYKIVFEQKNAKIMLSGSDSFLKSKKNKKIKRGKTAGLSKFAPPQENTHFCCNLL